jgi:hypothetical protein
MIDADELDECFFEYLENKLDSNVIAELQAECDVPSMNDIRCLNQ